MKLQYQARLEKVMGLRTNDKVLFVYNQKWLVGKIIYIDLAPDSKGDKYATIMVEGTNIKDHQVIKKLSELTFVERNQED